MLLSFFVFFLFAVSRTTAIVYESSDTSNQFDSLLTNFIEDDIQLDPPKTNFQAPTFLSETEVSSYHYPEYSAFARAAYCVRFLRRLDCGEHCADAELIYYTGDSALTPVVYVAWSPSLNSVIVAHEGVNPINFLSDEYLSTFNLVNPHPNMGVSGKVHHGFQAAWNRTIDDIMPVIQETLGKHSGASITTTGHSLGATLSLYDGLYFRNNLPGVNVITFVFGLPRSGNLEFAESVNDKLGSNVHYVVKDKDPIPHLGPYSFGYSQIPNQIWLPANGSVMFCPGIENANCADSVTAYNLLDHNKSYFGSVLLATCPR